MEDDDDTATLPNSLASAAAFARGVWHDRAENRGGGGQWDGYDGRTAVAVLNWGVGASLMDRSPWSAEVRRAQTWTVPKEKNPMRPGMDDDLRRGIITHATGWQLAAMLILGYETRRRNSSIRQLFWDDIDQDNWVVIWREEADKMGKELTVPLTERAIAVLRELPSRGIGHVPVFPSARDPAMPAARTTAQTWLKQAKDRWVAATPEEDRDALRGRLYWLGFHAELRSGVRDRGFRSLPPKLQETISGKTFGMLTSTYDEVTVSDMREQGDAIGIPENRLTWGFNCEH